ncbi:dephospho-CoA kinase [Flavobacteriales bacterium 34_180_T64]|nr:dephospho-CoA kinase [Flavobacteriales bacterium 34_180_T64]
MKIIGLTGGVGSGKTTVANFFAELGIPIYIADQEAKRLMNTSKVLHKKLKVLFGEKAFIDDGLNRPFIASKIFNDKNLLEQMNAIVHPKVGKHFKKWLKKQHSEYVIKEAAIIFEQQMESHYDLIVLVTADRTERIKRVLLRDQTNKDAIEAIIGHQLPDTDKIKKADFVISNNELNATKVQVLKTHKAILQTITNSKF